MNTLTARGYATSRLDREKLDTLHRAERRDGYCWMPYSIVSHFNLPEIGEVSEAIYRQAESNAWKIYEDARSNFKRSHIGCCFKPYSAKQSTACPDNPDVFVQHQADIKISANQVSFPSGGVGKLRDKFSGHMREEAA